MNYYSFLVWVNQKFAIVNLSSYFYAWGQSDTFNLKNCNMVIK